MEVSIICSFLLPLLRLTCPEKTGHVAEQFYQYGIWRRKLSTSDEQDISFNDLPLKSPLAGFYFAKLSQDKEVWPKNLLKYPHFGVQKN